MPEDRPQDPVPALSRIVGMRREDEVLHVELFARYTALDGRPLVLAQDVAGTATSDHLPHAGAEGRTWTMTLVLN
jgi:hypothetical protein